MISSSREKVFQRKQEGETNDETGKQASSKGGPSASSSSSRQWSGFRNPRIVRVSRSFGGKDRHSKVCTVRGLRDRRIRLSVPTAIQLYDLQDRLGLSQPSKVIDWLLDNTKDDIDKLPPLQIPQGLFGHQPPMLSNHIIPSSFATPPNLFDANNSMFIKDAAAAAAGILVEEDHQTVAAKRYWDKSKESAEREAAAEKGKWIKVNNDHHQQENQDNIGDNYQKLFPFTNNIHSSLPPAFFDPNYNYHWEPPSLSLSQFGNHGLFLPQTENFLSAAANTSTTVPLPHQLFFCPPSTVPINSLFPTFPPYGATPAPGDDHHSKQILNPFQLLSSNSQHSVTMTTSLMKPFSLNVNAGLTDPTQNDDDDDDDISHADDDQDNTDS